MTVTEVPELMWFWNRNYIGDEVTVNVVPGLMWFWYRNYIGINHNAAVLFKLRLDCERTGTNAVLAPGLMRF